MSERKPFSEHVSSWIKSCRSIETLDTVTKFINKSDQPDEVKAELLQEVNERKSFIKTTPTFQERDGEFYLIDEYGNVKVYATRFAAVLKVAELRMAGHEVELYPGKHFYRIRLNHESLMELIDAVV